MNWSNDLFHAAMGGANYGTLVQAWQEQRQYLFTGMFCVCVGGGIGGGLRVVLLY